MLSTRGGDAVGDPLPHLRSERARSDVLAHLRPATTCSLWRSPVFSRRPGEGLRELSWPPLLSGSFSPCAPPSPPGLHDGPHGRLCARDRTRPVTYRARQPPTAIALPPRYRPRHRRARPAARADASDARPVALADIDRALPRRRVFPWYDCRTDGTPTGRPSRSMRATTPRSTSGGPDGRTRASSSARRPRRTARSSLRPLTHARRAVDLSAPAPRPGDRRRLQPGADLLALRGHGDRD
jgi:hypothetical protein